MAATTTNQNIPELVMLIGLPACGKSTYAEGLKTEGYDVISSDAVRAGLFGSEGIQGNPKQVFGIVKQRVHDTLANGRSVVCDATNLGRKKRIDLMKGKEKRFEAWQWLAIAQLVNWHMVPLNSWSRSPKAQEKEVKLLGLSMYYDILAIHEADMNAH